MKWYIQVLKKYAVFSGRAQRMEYWMFTLFNVIIAFVLGFIEGTFSPANNSDLLGNLYTLGILFPTLAVAARRLHDTGKSGWWQLLWFIPIIGWIVLLVFLVRDSDEGDNQYGPNPKMQEINTTSNPNE